MLPARPLRSLAALLLAAQVHAYAGTGGRAILVVESYHPGFTWDSDYRRALVARLAPAYTLTFVALDTKRLPPEKHAAMADLAWAAYLKRQPALVILGDDAALRLLAPRLAATTTPVVYLSINNNPRAYFDPRVVRNITGVLERPMVKRSVAEMRKLLPRARRVLFLFDADMTSTVLMREVLHDNAHQIIEGVAVDIRLVPTWKQWQGAVLAAAADGYDAIFIGPAQSFRSGASRQQQSIAETVRWTSANTVLPTFALWDFAVGPDMAVGGLVLGGYEQGTEAADIALKILRGAAPSSIYPITAGHGSFLFSRRQLQRFQLALPGPIAEQSRFTD